MSVLRALADDGFTAAVSAPGVTLVNFTAAWCPPCAKAAEEVAGLAQDLRARPGFAGAIVMTADLDRAQDAALAADVRGLPTLVMFRDGVRVGNLLGSMPRAAMRAWVDNLVKGKM